MSPAPDPAEHLGLVHWVIHRHFPLRADDPDLFQAGCVGLLGAARAFDPALGYAFATYATRPVLWACRRHLRRERAARVRGSGAAAVWTRTFTDLGLYDGPGSDLQGTLDPPAAEEPEPAYGPDERAAVVALLAGCTPGEAATLRRWAGLDGPATSGRELAAELGVSHQRVYQLIARGVQRLRGRVRADPALTKLFGDHLWRLDGKPTAPPPRPRRKRRRSTRPST